MRDFPVLLLLCVGLIVHVFPSKLHSQGSVSATYSSSIPTSQGFWDFNCNGFSSRLYITLPVGENFDITSIDLDYDFVSVAPNNPTSQQSYLYFENTGASDITRQGSIVTQGATENYTASTNFANGTFPGGTLLTFQIRAWRTNGTNNNCSLDDQYISSYTVTVNYTENVVPKVGINTSTPEAVLDVNGKLKVGDDIVPPIKGMLRFAEADSSLQFYNGNRWAKLDGSLYDIDGDTGISAIDKTGNESDEIAVDLNGYGGMLIKQNDFGSPIINPDVQYNNVFIGRNAGENSQSSELIGIGVDALRNSSGAGQVAIGFNTLTKSNGFFNIALGYNAMSANEDGEQNIAIGEGALFRNRLGELNIALGPGTLVDNVRGSENIAIGLRALASVDSTSTLLKNNIAIGNNAMSGSYNGTQKGAQNIAIGLNALNDNVDGDNNIVIGNMTAEDNTSGSNNILIGSNSFFVPSPEVNNSIIIGQSMNAYNPHELRIGDDDDAIIEGDLQTLNLRFEGQVGIGEENTESSAALAIDQLGRGFLPTRNMNSSITSPANGLINYQPLTIQK